jgi:hypothetical protein
MIYNVLGHLRVRPDADGISSVGIRLKFGKVAARDIKSDAMAGTE